MSRTVQISSALLAIALAACSGKDGAAGSNGHSTLVLVVAEPAGAHCAEGGVAIEQGEDANGNGVLDPSEVNAAETVYVCNGAMGDAGTAAGMAALVKVTTEPAGTNCQFGGERIDSGIDTNGDGILETSEITSTSYICNGNTLDGYHFGDIYISQPSDFAQLTGVTHLVGNLIIESTVGFGYAVSVPGLLTVDGSIGLDGDFNDDRDHNGGPAAASIASISFPDLTSASGLYLSSQGTLTSISFPSLTAAAEIEISQDPMLSSLDLSSLAQCGSYFQIYDTALTAISLPAFTFGTYIAVQNSSQLTSLTMPKLIAADELYLYDLSALTTLDLSSLAQTTSEFELSNSSALTTLSLPMLTSAGYFEINSNSALATLTAPKLTAALYFDVENNALLSSCTVAGLYAQLSPQPSSGISGNAPLSSYCTLGPQPAEITIAGITDSLYLGTVGYSFDNAELGCRTLGAGGHLLWFESAAELTAFTDAANTTTTTVSVLPNDAWIGYADASDATIGFTTTSGTWAALSGDNSYDAANPSNTSFWDQGYGVPSAGGSSCAAMYGQVGTATNLTDCSYALNFVCRVPAATASRSR